MEHLHQLKPHQPTRKQGVACKNNACSMRSQDLQNHPKTRLCDWELQFLQSKEAHDANAFKRCRLKFWTYANNLYLCRHVIWYYVDDDDNGDKWSFMDDDY